MKRKHHSLLVDPDLEIRGWGRVAGSLLALTVFLPFSFLRHKTVKTNDKIRRFGVVMTPLSRKI